MTTISFSGLELRFLQDHHATGGSLDMFQMIVQPRANMPVAHFHDRWDETVYGLAETTIWRIGGQDHPIGAGQSVFIPRGTVHGFRNDGADASTCLCVLTPGVLGPEYFQEMAALAASGAPDPEQMKSVMSRYGLIPAPNG